jgi:hypothetical protein
MRWTGKLAQLEPRANEEAGARTPSGSSMRAMESRDVEWDIVKAAARRAAPR